jgi:glycosyltransferase involved in cell wall biosynthesis
MSKLISVIVPCYNQAQFLDETLQSILNQTYSNWECIIVNDGSPDNTEEIAQKWKIKDTRFSYVKKENGGLSSARNKGLEVAKGDFIQFLDSDDLLVATKFEQSIMEIENENADIVITNFLRFKKDLNHQKKAFCKLEEQTFSFDTILLFWDVKFSIPIHCGLFSAKIINEIRFNEKLKAKEDWMFWIDFFRSNPKVSFVNENLVFYRMHSQGMTKNSALMEENLRTAYSLIYNSLDDKNKEKFFERLMLELAHAKNEYKEFKDNIFYRKLFYSFKKLFK